MNSFTVHGTTAAGDELRMTNGGTDVFLDVLTLAACALARTPWQQNLALHFADGHRLGRGDFGYDLSELPWTAGWPQEKDFHLEVIDAAAAGHGWERLDHPADRARAYLAAYRPMLAGFTPVPVFRSAWWGDWRIAPPAERLERCPRHEIYEGELGCRLCAP
ncbi:hypothetical protein [Actinomadura macrotermitis]|uniref:Uncharacterized protein n=1 Tax=Actinomadura macrotermitis TaxID=2585200 RepID=A0A7K0BZM6_9ACTN|nr:hypothetical protein [Actinomadura macrotermitis]MQY06619.1 hypothetical protein [Actinomadura macrotermitis]